MNRNLWLYCILCCVGLILITESHAQWKLSEINLAHKYNESPEITLGCQTVLTDANTLIINIALSLHQTKANPEDYTFSFYQTESLETKLNETDPSTIDSLYLGSSKGQHYFKFVVSRPSKWLIVGVTSQFSGGSFYFDFPITSLHSPDFSIYESDHILESSFTISPKLSTDKPVTVFYYNHTFGNALPPMVTKTPLPEKSLSVDSLFQWPANSTQTLLHEGLYFFQQDTSIASGRSLRLENKYFPKTATLTQLIEPLVYITTRDEKQELDHVTEKKGFDQFWLNLTRSPERAKKIIQAYYTRVERSNELFTTFKPGWKTDMGMIYIIFGPPDTVTKTDSVETWVYLENPFIPTTTFKFLKTTTIFSSSHYVLIRDNKHHNNWFKAVDLWRKGRF